MLTVKNVNSQWNKPEFDSRYLVYKYNDRAGDLLSLLPFFKNEHNLCLINQIYVVFYLGKIHYLIFYTGMILSMTYHHWKL